MKKIIRGVLLSFAAVFAIIVSLQSLSAPVKIDEQLNLATLIATPVSAVDIRKPVNIDDLSIQDNMEIYRVDDPTSVVTIFVTVRVGNSSDNTNHTWQEVNDFTKYAERVVTTRVVDKAEAIVQFGDENGPLPGELGYGEVMPNATIQLRGQSSTLSAQKSYKIELRNRAGSWRGQSTIALNKHPFDQTRIKNKLCFDLMKDIPDIISLRTQFVHLYVKDETTDPPEDTFVDYGLYTQIEQPNKAFLRNHLLDPNGQLYKASSFEFFRYPDQIRLATDPLYDESVFSTVLEIKGNRDHSKLIQMLDDVNNYAMPIEQVFEEHFNADNYFTWLAFNILVGNQDILTQDFILYSPLNSKTWYFLPWDYDGVLHRQESEYFGGSQYYPWAKGFGTNWGVVLHRRVLQVEKYRNALDEKITELKDSLTAERLENMITAYRTVTDEYVTRMPDLRYLYTTVEDYNLRLNMLPAEIDINYQLYLESLHEPMPFFLDSPEVYNGELIFSWGESYDLDAQSIDYHFILSRNWEFSDIVYEETVSNLTEITIAIPDPGTYFWRVVAENEDGKIQYPFDVYWDAEGGARSGMKYLYITPDGQVLEV